LIRVLWSLTPKIQWLYKKNWKKGELGKEEKDKMRTMKHYKENEKRTNEVKERKSERRV